MHGRVQVSQQPDTAPGISKRIASRLFQLPSLSRVIPCEHVRARTHNRCVSSRQKASFKFKGRMLDGISRAREACDS